MKFILKLKNRLKFYTKESLKYVTVTIIAFVFINTLIFTKYKPVYAVYIGEENVGYITNKEEFENEVQQNVVNYTAQNVESVEISDTPTYELTLVDKAEQTNEKEIIIAMQKDMNITYQYYEIALNDEVIDYVSDYEEAQKMIEEIKQDNEELNLTINKKTTSNEEEIKSSEISVAKANILNKVESETAIGVVEGIKLAVKPVEGVISSRYGVSSRIRVSTHTGLDIAASTGTPIKVVSDGTVISAAYTGSYGNLVKVSHGNGVETWYAHTSKMYVKAGQEVKAGDVIAAVGSTGNSTGAHLHFEIRINGNHVNPQQYIYNN